MITFANFETNLQMHVDITIEQITIQNMVKNV